MGMSALVVDGDDLARQAMRRALEQACACVEHIFEACSIDEARRAMDGHGQAAALPAGASGRTVDLLLIEPELPDGDGRQLLAARAGWRTTTVVVSCRRDDVSVGSALDLGAAGYLLKDDTAEVWADALGGLALGRPALSPALTRRLMVAFARRTRGLETAQARIGPAPPLAEGEVQALSPRETEVLTYLSKGLTIREIAVLLGIRWFTVNDHIKSIYRKLDVSSRAEAAVLATRLGLV